MRLLRAELRTLNRPLLWGVTLAAMFFCVLLAVSGAAHAHRYAGGSADRMPSCAELAMQDGPVCANARAGMRVRQTVGRMRDLAAEADTAAQLDPLAAGAEAAGLMASLPGALAIALLAGGHLGGEWSGRTLKNMLTECGHRWRLLAAKLISLWLAGAGLIAACWAALAVAGPILVRADHLPDPHQTAAEAAGWAASQAGRALLVLAVFSAVGVLAAVVTRGAVGTMATSAGVVVLTLVAAALPATGRWTPATWVQGWMGFATGLGSVTPLPSNFWSRFITTGSPPGHVLGFTGLVTTIAGCTLVALALFRRVDVS
jgi:hypothetical protein